MPRPRSIRSGCRADATHVAGLTELQTDYATWLDALPDNQQDSVTAAALRAIVGLDLSEVAAIEPRTPSVVAILASAPQTAMK
jgi:hypothetical protein